MTKVVLLALVLLAAAPAVASADTVHLLVRFKASADAAARADARRAAGVERERGLALPGLERVRVRDGASAAAAVARLERDPAVSYAEPDVAIHAASSPSDPGVRVQWALEEMHALQAWDVTTGDPNLTIGVLDSGADLDHPDLTANLVPGYDFVDEDTAPWDTSTLGHGTHVAGIIGAVSNNRLGIAGLNWRVRLLPVRILDDNLSGVVSNEVDGIAYAVRAGARIVNLSLNSDRSSRAEYDAIAAAPETLFVIAAGNGGTDTDAQPTYPCGHDLPNIICVTATDLDDSLPWWANRGATSVDVGAPGVGIYSTVPGPSPYATMDGTSMAAPQVAGAAGLLLAKVPAARPEDLIQAIMKSADRDAALAGLTVSGGRLNIAAALASVRATPRPVPVPTPVPAPPFPTPTPAPPGPQDALLDPALLKVRRAAVTNGRLILDARISRRAVGSVRLSFRSHGRTTTLASRIVSGRIRVSSRLPRAQRRGSGTLTLTWAGSSAVQGARVKLRAASQAAHLKRRSVKLADGVLRAQGTISKRARGSVRFEFASRTGSRLASASFSARIRDGRWKLSARVPAAARAGGFLTIRFAGSGTLSGEQDAIPVSP